MPKSTRSRSTVDIHGYALRVVRELKRRPVQDLADALDVDRSYIAKIETGHSRRVSTLFYNRLLEELAITDYRALMATPPARDDESKSA